MRDLVCWYPHRYIDLSNRVPCASAPLGETVSVVGRLEGVRQKQPRPGMHVIEAAVVDETGAMALVWFKQPWLINSLHPGPRLRHGKGRLQLRDAPDELAAYRGAGPGG